MSELRWTAMINVVARVFLVSPAKGALHCNGIGSLAVRANLRLKFDHVVSDKVEDI